MAQALPYLTITAICDGPRLQLRLSGELDVSNQCQLRHVIGLWAQAQQARPVLVLDLSQLRFLDCAGLSALLWAHRRLAGQGGELVLAAAQPPVLRLLRLTAADSYLQLSPR